MAKFDFKDTPELEKLGELVEHDPSSFEAWDNLINAAENQEGGLHRNSAPAAIAATRAIYDHFLAQFPLYYGYWNRYATFEWSIAGTESAEMIYERGVSCAGPTVDLWMRYCSFKATTCHQAVLIRELYELGAQSIGLDFSAHPFWDSYLEFESRAEEPDRVFLLLQRIVQIPLQQYQSYYERYKVLAARRPITDLADQNTLSRLQVSLQKDLGAAAADRTTYELELRKRVDNLAWENFRRVQAEVNKRVPFEQNIQRPFFHTEELAAADLENWSKYLDFEESEGDYTRTKFLYERCLVTAATYEEFWFRYVRWMLLQDDKVEEIRSIYERAGSVFMKVSQSAIRLARAKYEESQGRPEVAIEIHEMILQEYPSDFETCKALVHTRRRNDGIDAAYITLLGLVGNTAVSYDTRGALVNEWARLKWQLEGDFEAANQIFHNHKAGIAGSLTFWSGWMHFISSAPKGTLSEDEIDKRVRTIWSKVRESPNLSEDDSRALASQYMQYLETRSDSASMRQLIEIDAYVNGPTNWRNAKNLKMLVAAATSNGSQAVEATQKLNA